MLEEETLNAATVPTLSHPGLLVMDVDSTLIDEEVIDELGVAAGVGDRIASVTARAMNGELDFRDALRARVALLKDLPISMFDDVYHAVHFTNGALALIDALHDYGWKVGVVSGGFHEVVDRLASDANIDYWIANRLETADGRLTGPRPWRYRHQGRQAGIIAHMGRPNGSQHGANRGRGRRSQRSADDSCGGIGRGILRQTEGPAGGSAPSERT